MHSLASLETCDNTICRHTIPRSLANFTDVSEELTMLSRLSYQVTNVVLRNLDKVLPDYMSPRFRTW